VIGLVAVVLAGCSNNGPYSFKTVDGMHYIDLKEEFNIPDSEGLFPNWNQIWNFYFGGICRYRWESQVG